MKDISAVISSCTESQLRQYVDSSSAFRHLQSAKRDAAEVRGGMIWREVGERRYLVRTSPTGAQHSLGPDSEENRKVFAAFTKRKRSTQETLAARKQVLEQMRKLNRAYGVGRAPQAVISVLNAFEKAGIADQFMVVGSQAIYAYETAAGVRVVDGALDTRKHISFVTTMTKIDSSFIQVLRSADKSFREVGDKLKFAINKDGFEVGIVRKVARDGAERLLHMSAAEVDIWAAQIGCEHGPLSARRLEQMVVSPRGEMALMKAVHPVDFIAVKRELATKKSRDDENAAKDLLQAQAVQYLWDEVLSHRY